MPAKKKTKTREPAFPLPVWLENSKKMAGHPRYVLVGATEGRDPEAKYTRAEMAKAIKTFLAMR